MIRDLVGFFLKIWVLLGTIYLAIVVANRYDLIPPPPQKWVTELRNARQLVDEANKLADKAQPVAKALSDVSNAVTAPLQLLMQVLKAIPQVPGVSGIQGVPGIPPSVLPVPGGGGQLPAGVPSISNPQLLPPVPAPSGIPNILRPRFPRFP